MEAVRKSWKIAARSIRGVASVSQTLAKIRTSVPEKIHLGKLPSALRYRAETALERCGVVDATDTCSSASTARTMAHC